MNEDSGLEGIESVTLSAPGHEPRTMTGKRFVSAVRGMAYMPPADSTFVGDFQPAEALTALAQELCGRHDELTFILDWRLEVLWKRNGGRKGGGAVMGKCLLPSGIAKFYSHQDWVIWLAADWVREMEFNSEQVEALVFHELHHCALKEKGDPPVVEPTTRGHDLEIFLPEVEVYGLWDERLQEAGPVFGKQLALFEASPEANGG